MLATFVIGLREGLEAALIVSIVAAFLRKQGRSELLRAVLIGIGAAVVLCAAAGVLLRVVSRDLPQRQQEGMETVIGLVAVAMVTYMVVWMRRHARELKGHLESAAGQALATGSGWALVMMAFLAVLREGFETAVFLLAAVNESQSGSLALAGAILGVSVAIGLGYVMYRGGVRINLAKFFRATGVVLVLVAAGLVASALHTAHEAGWLNAGQQFTVDLSPVVGPGTIQGALLTGVLGIQPRPVLIELAGWSLYVIVVLPYVIWPPQNVPERRTVARVSAVGALVMAGLAAILLAAAPAEAAPGPVAGLDGATVQRIQAADGQDQVRLTLPADWQSPAATPAQTQVLTRSGHQLVNGLNSDVFSASTKSIAPVGPATLSGTEVAGLNGGRLPLGLSVADASVPVTYSAIHTVTVALQPDTGRVVDLRAADAVTTSAQVRGSVVPLSGIRETTRRPAQAAVAAEVRTAKRDISAAHRRAVMHDLALIVAVIAAVMILITILTRVRLRANGSRAPVGTQIRV